MRLRKYANCIADIERLGLTRRQIAAMIGVDEAVISRRMSGKQSPTIEALIVVNTLAEVFNNMDDESVVAWRERGWIAQKIKEATTLKELGRVA